MQRILKGAPNTIQTTLLVGEVLTDSSTAVTVTVIRDDGTVLVTDAATTHPSTGVYQYTLTPTHTSRVDVLTAQWTATIAGEEMTLETFVEVVGGFYFTLADARASDADLVSTTKYTTAQIREARDEVEDECETICGVSFVRRYRRVTLSGDGCATLLLPNLFVRSVFGISVGGVALTEDELADVVVEDIGRVYWRSGVFAQDRLNVDVMYEHGFDAPPSDVRRAALTRLQHRLFAKHTAVPDRATAFVAGEGGNFSLATPGKGGSETGIPEVDATYARHNYHVPSVA